MRQSTGSNNVNVQTPSLGSAVGSTAAKASKKKGLNFTKPNKKIVIWGIIVVLALALAGGGYYFYDRYQDVQAENKLLSNPQEAAKIEQEQLIASVSTLTELPSGETPTVATVSDASKLKTQAFFADSANGDKVLIYSQAKKAYLYRPSTNKVVNIAPVNIGNNENSDTSQ